MELPKRKQIRLQGYDYSQNGGYFLTLCTYNRANLFGEIIGDALSSHPNNPDRMIEKWLFEIENKYHDTKVDYYVIMPDHVHIVLFLLKEIGDSTGPSLPTIVDWFKTMTTNEYIKGVKSGLYPPFDKYVWQRNYFEHIIRNEDDLYEIRKYIRDNPQDWEKLYMIAKCAL